MALQQQNKQAHQGPRGKSGLANQQAKKTKRKQKKREGKRSGAGKKGVEPPKTRGSRRTRTRVERRLVVRTIPVWREEIWPGEAAVQRSRRAREQREEEEEGTREWELDGEDGWEAVPGWEYGEGEDEEQMVESEEEMEEIVEVEVVGEMDEDDEEEEDEDEDEDDDDDDDDDENKDDSGERGGDDREKGGYWGTGAEMLLAVR